MLALDFVLDTVSHFVKLEDSPPPGVPAHAGGAFEQDLLKLCERLRISPVVSHSLGRLVLPPGLSRIAVERLKENGRHASETHSRLEEKLVRTASFFHEKGIPFVVCGERASADMLYPQKELRPVEKLDLLVREDDWRGITECLHDAGFASTSGCGRLESSYDALQFHQFFAPCVFKDKEEDEIRLIFRVFSYGCPETQESAWKHTRRIASLPWPADELGVEDHLIRSAIELNLRGFQDLLLIADISLMMVRFGNGLDWEYLEERLRSKGFFSAIYFAVRHSGSLMRLPHVWERLRYPGRAREKIFAFLWGLNRARDFGVDSGERSPFMFHMLGCGHHRERVGILKRILSPDPKWVSMVYGRPYNRRRRVKFILKAIAGNVVDTPREGQLDALDRSADPGRRIPK